MDIIGPIIVILFIIVPLIGVVTSKMREISQPPARPGGPGDNRRIQEQIDEFLRRAGQRRGGAPAAAPPPQPAAAEVLDDDQVGSGVGRQASKFLDTSELRRRSSSLGDDVAQGDEQFAQQVQKAFSGEVSRLSTRRGDTAAPTEVVEAEAAEAEAAEQENASRPTLQALPAAGSGLADLLGSSDSIAHAIIMSEILRRPEW